MVAMCLCLIDRNYLAKRRLFDGKRHRHDLYLTVDWLDLGFMPLPTWPMWKLFLEKGLGRRKYARNVPALDAQSELLVGRLPHARVLLRMGRKRRREPQLLPRG